MKLALPTVLFFSISSFAQTAQTSYTSPITSRQVVNIAKTFGYVDGVRLDSIDARYAEFNWRLLQSGLTFDYGQSGAKRRKMVITDKDGRLLVFEPNNITMILNFFYFNGWELAHVYNATTGGVDTFILKRK